MKQLILISFLLVFLASCKKEIRTLDSTAYLQNVRTELKDSLAVGDYGQLDFDKAVLNKVDSVQLYFLRIPFKGSTLANDFVILNTDHEGKIKEGRIIQLEGTENQVGDGVIKRRRFDGSVSISSLERKLILNSPIKNGYITAYHEQQALRAQGDDPIYPSNDMPEVVIVTYVHTISEVSFSDLYLLTSFFYGNNLGYGGGTSGGYYGSAGGDGSISSGGGGYSGGGTQDPNIGVSIDPTIQVDIDTYVNKDPIILEQYLKCFDNVPDAGADCEITIYADIPVDNDPNKLFDFSTGSPGHTFIQLKKTNGSQSVMQNIGFYPLTGWKSISDLPTDAKFVDDSQHEFNAALSKTLTPDQLRSVITEIRNKATSRYDLDDFNCTDWSLDIFNNQGYSLTIPKYLIPGSINAAGVNTPQGLYNKLNEMKSTNAANSDKISIGFQKGWVADSHGPCN